MSCHSYCERELLLTSSCKIFSILVSLLCAKNTYLWVSVIFSEKSEFSFFTEFHGSIFSFSPTDVKLATASDDGTVRVWDFIRCEEERIMRGHGSDVRSVDWHPQKGLLVSGSRDSQQPVKIWDPKSGTCLATL